MGQTVSAQPKLSGEMTLNRIRTACQRDDTMPAELKKFNVQLLVNDMNTLGFDIPLQSNNGKEYDADELCKEIKKKALPDVEELCMMNASKKGEAMHAVEQMVGMFNKYYGARIQTYKNPLDKSRGKRGVQELCDDLYLVMDKMKRRLADRPAEIKGKLQQMIAELEYKKKMIDGQFGAMMSNLRMAKNQDKMDEKLKLAETLQNIVSDELGKQTHMAREEFGRLVHQLESQAKLPGSNGQASPFQNEIANLENKLRGYRQIRFMDLKDEKVKHLLDIVKTSVPVVQECESCVKKFGLKIEDYLASTPLGRSKFEQQLTNKFEILKRASKDNKELGDLVRCYEKLMNERDQCTRGTAFSQELSSLQQAHSFGDLKDIDSVASLIVSNWKRGPLATPPSLSYGSVQETMETNPYLTRQAAIQAAMAGNPGLSEEQASALIPEGQF